METLANRLAHIEVAVSETHKRIDAIWSEMEHRQNRIKKLEKIIKKMEKKDE